jgi:hypothetical protein
MREIVTTKGGALAVPDTLACYELGAPIPKAVQDFVVKHFALPVLLKYGGATMADHEKQLVLVEYAEDCVGFLPDAYRLAVKLMGRDRRKSNWRPDTGECRDWLQKAEDNLCAMTGRPKQVRDQDELRRAMLGALSGVDGESIDEEYTGSTFSGKRTRSRFVTFPTVWERERFGPMPSEPGCRLDAATQRECWLRLFRVRDWALDQLDIPRSRASIMRHRARHLEALGVAVAPPTCPILRAVMTELGVPMTPVEIAAADTEIADYQAKVAARKAEEEERARIKREQEAAAAKQWEAEQEAAKERHRVKWLESLAADMADLSPDVESARSAWRANAGSQEHQDAFYAARKVAADSELQMLLTDPAYAGACRAKLAAVSPAAEQERLGLTIS